MAINQKLLIPDSAIEPSFKTVKWSGDGASTRSITGVGFEPDLVWVKARQSQNHTIYDSVRGTGRFLSSGDTGTEFTATTYGQLTSFDSDGFTGSLGSNQTYSYFNSSSQTYVAWCFNAGNNEVTNTDGTINTTVRANNDLGFSIATYTGVGYPNSTTAEIGHGLDSAPEMVIIKGYGGTGQSGGAGSWAVGSSLLGSGWDGGMYLNSNAAYSNATNYFWNGSATSSVIKLKNDWFVNGANNNYVAYSFVSKTGVSKVGTYTGNGTTNNEITTGFEPAFLMFKGTDQTSDWIMLDNVRDTSNPNSARLDANSSNAEYNGENLVNFNSDGFTLVTSSASKNGDENKFIYYAVADI